MNIQFDNMRAAVADLKEKLTRAETKLANAERDCRHDWTKPEADNIYRESYTIPGDRPGTMGVDFRGPCYVPAETTYRWKRTCTICGKMEHTQRTKENVTHTPTFD